MPAPTFSVVAQSPWKLRVTFSHEMLYPDVLDATNYVLRSIGDGTVILISEAWRVLETFERVELHLGDGLVPFGAYSLTIADGVTSGDDFEPLFPNQAVVQWHPSVPRPIRIPIRAFSGEASGGLLGLPAGRVFISPAFTAPAVVDYAGVEVEAVGVCTKAFDVYTLPAAVAPAPPLFTFPARAGASPTLGPSGGVLWAPAHQLGQAVMRLADFQDDLVAAPVHGVPEGILVEPIDITRASFLNDGRWRTFPGTGASLGAFRTADNLTPIGPGPTTGPFAIG